MNEDIGVCIKYAPGEIVSLQLHPTADDTSVNFQAASRSRDSALLDSNNFYGGRIIVALHAVPAGSEIWQLLSMQQAEPRSIFSLNYLGSSAGFLFGASKRNTAASSFERLWYDRASATVQDGWKFNGSTGCVMIVDISKEHCGDVMRAAAEGSTGMAGDVPIYGIHLTRSTSSLATVHEYMILLLTAMETAPAPIISVNMSIDFGQACGQSEAHKEGASTVSLSFPIFERALIEAREALSVGGIVPAFFAAAGNKLRRGKPGWRLAYPAVRPEVIAVTSASESAHGSMQLSDQVDYPAVHEFKPCFAVPAQEVALSGIKNPGTTSMASGFAAGRYAALAMDAAGDELRRAPPLAKVAQLQASSRRHFLFGDETFWGRPGVHPMPRSPVKVQRCRLELLLRELNQKFAGNEFVVTGSLGALAGLLRQNPGIEWGTLRGVSLACGDIDLVSAVPLRQEEMSQCRRLVVDWLATWSLFDHSIDFAHRDASASLPTLSQAIIPAAQLAVTQDGIVDGHGGLSDIGNHSLRILVPDQSVWNSNPAYRTGAAGCALGLLVWINTSLLLDIAAAHLTIGKRSVCRADGKPANTSFLNIEELPRLEAEIQKHDKELVSAGIPAARMRKLRPRLDRTFALIRLAKTLCLDVTAHLRVAVEIEKKFLCDVANLQKL